MKNEKFIAVPKASQFTDVKSAIDSLSGMVRGKNDPDLLLKVGEIQGAYAVYERTKDISVLEHLIIDLVLLLEKLLTLPTPWPSMGAGHFVGRTDLIYLESCEGGNNGGASREASDRAVTVDELIEDFVKGYSLNTGKVYSAALRTVCMEGLGVFDLSVYGLRDLAVAIANFIRENPSCNHNVKSAAGGFVKYLHERAAKQ